MGYIGRAMTPKLVTGRSASNPRPTTEYDAAAGTTLPAGATFSRASGATSFTRYGLLSTVSVDAMRLTYDPALTYNLIINPWADGSGTVPDLWAVGVGANITPVFMGVGVRNGIPYSRWRVQGVSNGGGFPNIRASVVGVTAGRVGDAFSEQMYLEIARVGPTNDLALDTGLAVSVVGYTTGGVQTEISSTNNDNVRRTFADGPIRVTRTMVNAGTEWIIPRLTISNALGRVHDYDIDIGFPILNRGAGVYLADTVPVQTLAYRINDTPQYGLQGVMLEEASTNLLANSIGMSALTATGIVATDDATASPMGSINASMLDDGTDASQHIIQSEVFTTVTGTSYTASWFMKAGTCTFAQLSWAGAGFGTSQRCNFDLVNGTFNATGGTGAMQYYGNGWWRCAFTAVATADNANVFSYVAMVNSLTSIRSESYTGTNRTMYAFGRQVEERFAPSSFIVSNGSATTRAREELTLSADTITDFTRASVCMRYSTLRFGSTAVTPGTTQALFFGTTNNRVNFRNAANQAALPIMELFSGGALQANYSSGAFIPDTFHTGCIAWGGGTADGAWDSNAGTTDTSATAPSVTPPAVFRINGTVSPTIGTNIILRFIRVWNGQRLTRAQVARESAKTQ